MMARDVVLLPLLLAISFGVFGIANGQASLSTTYYNTTCPSVQSIVDLVVSQTISEQGPNIVGGLLRLHFHDCFVRGCDGSVLIDSTKTNEAEKDGPPNINSLRGFDVIDSVKSALEAVCPGVVSCADVVAMVARSSVSMIGGPTWVLPLGRRDGNISNATETTQNLQPGSAEFPALVTAFAKKGLDEHDMVVLSGAHTIGHTHCKFVEPRLYNLSGAVAVDPSLNPTFADDLIALCPFSNSTSLTMLQMDPKGYFNFDNNYYQAVSAHRGIFTSDASLLTNATASQIVAQESSNNAQFFTDFALAMTKMGEIEVKLAPDGDVRLNCSVLNPPALAPTPGPSAASTPIPGPAPAPASSASVLTPGPALAPVPTASTLTPGPAQAPAPTVTTPIPGPAPAAVPTASTPTPGPVPAPVPSGSTLNS